MTESSTTTAPAGDLSSVQEAVNTQGESSLSINFPFLSHPLLALQHLQLPDDSCIKLFEKYWNNIQGYRSLPERVLTYSKPFSSPVEFYLSNSNLPFDKFLFGLWSRSFQDPAAVIASTPPPEGSPVHPQSKNKLNSFHLGWLPLEKIASFKRMQPYTEAPPKGLGSVDAIAEVVKERSDSVEVRKFGNESDAGYGWYVRRTSEMKRPEDALQRSVYAKGFPATEKEGETDEEKQSVKDNEQALQKKLEEWARGLGVGKVLSLRMRREDKPGQDGKAAQKGRGKFKVSCSFPFSLSAIVVSLLIRILLACRDRFSSNSTPRKALTSSSLSTPNLPTKELNSRPSLSEYSLTASRPFTIL